ncbi:hypothetical protein [Ahrensia sp. R2A130]|uniref:hypothetical protein n=1 Tax=Ahrensia sp. R2A130 TaxID=744979 RepID=UPI0012EA9DB1|nr:hypothetical protein [Ahrensia sp. R2A130]
MRRFITTLFAVATLAFVQGCTSSALDTASDDLVTGSITAAVPVGDEDDHIWLEDCPECDFNEILADDLPDV